VDDLVARHQRACDDFTRVARAVQPPRWSDATPCTAWTARDLVEHVIGFHEFLLLRPLGVRANRPREDPAARWAATADALFAALAVEGAVDRATELPGGGQSTPRQMLSALTTDVLVHTWDLARATGIAVTLAEELCADAYAAARGANIGRDSGMVGPEVAVDDDTDTATKLIALYGRDPSWTPRRAP
jgi:uncharacterized protein (TIGR03086 family)